MVRLVILLVSFGFAACVEHLPQIDGEQGVTKQCELDRQCPANAPYCRSNFCIECEDDSQCTGIRPACSDQRCVECVDNAHCPSGLPACSNERCVECVSDSDCPANRAACSNERCIECLEDSHCPTDRPLCENRSCIACRNHTDCPLDRGLCLANQCNVDPSGLATWDHRHTVLAGDGSYHGAALGSPIDMERISQMVRGGWTIDILGSSGWARLVAADSSVAAIHRSGLLLTRVVDDEHVMWGPKWEQMRAYGPGIRLDTRGLVGYGTLRQLVLDLGAVQALSLSGVLDLLEGATHRFEMAQKQTVMISDTLLGSVRFIDGVGSDSLSRLERSAWPERYEMLVGEVNDSVVEKRIKFSLDEAGSFELYFVDREPELCTRFLSLTAAVSVDECRDCAARIAVEINGEPVEKTANQRWGMALDAGEHEILLRAVSSETDESDERCAVFIADRLRLRGVLESQPEWLRAVVRTPGNLILSGWDQGSRSSLSYNRNRRPTVLKLPLGEISDNDFDGWPDGSDLCLGLADSMSDQDQDGIGDACDGVFNTVWQDDSTLQALDHNGQVLFEYEDLESDAVVQIVPVARTAAFPHTADFVNKSAIEQMLIIKAGMRSPARVVNGLGQTVFTVFDTQPTQLGRVSSDGQFTLFTGIREDRRTLLIKGMNAFGTRSNVVYSSSNPKGVARLVPGGSTLATFLGNPGARLMMLGQTNKPIHTEKLSGSLVAGYVGDCTEDGICDENSSCHDNLRCSIQPETPERCFDGEELRAMRTCVPDDEIGYCVKSRVDDSGDPQWAGSSFSACEPNEQTCLEHANCPDDLVCLLGRCRRHFCYGEDPSLMCPDGQICLGGYGADGGICVPAVRDERCGEEEHCVSSNGVFLELKGALARHGTERGVDRFGTANILTIPLLSLHSRTLQNMGEITWCHPSLEVTGSFALGENESRETLKKLFDGRTPWRELFRLGLTQAEVIEGDNFVGLSHAEETRCRFLDTDWSINYDHRLNALEMEIVDIDRDGMEEVRIGYGIEGSESPTIWRCYDVFGSLVPGDCTP